MAVDQHAGQPLGGAFVATFMALYLTLERGYSASYAGLVAALHGLGGGVVSSLGGPG